MVYETTSLGNQPFAMLQVALIQQQFLSQVSHTISSMTRCPIHPLRPCGLVVLVPCQLRGRHKRKLRQSIYVGACTWLTKFAAFGQFIVQVGVTGVMD